jgi:hypothetical protein
MDWPTPNCRSSWAIAVSTSSRAFEPSDLFYSFGIHNPGAVRLHNYPKSLQDLVQDNGDRFDLGTIDILRDRERGVPRYNRFRELLHKAPVRSFEELTDVPEWAAQLKEIYNNDLALVDTMVGMMAEPLQEGMGFSETAFRIFLLMASAGSRAIDSCHTTTGPRSTPRRASTGSRTTR